MTRKLQPPVHNVPELHSHLHRNRFARLQVKERGANSEGRLLGKVSSRHRLRKDRNRGPVNKVTAAFTLGAFGLNGLYYPQV